MIMTNKELIKCLQEDLDNYGERTVYINSSPTYDIDVVSSKRLCLLN